MEKTILLQSVITCPGCGHQQEETMPTNACQFFYECTNCKSRLKPQAGDCCVFLQLWFSKMSANTNGNFLLFVDS
jgi:hypothetical protein